MLGARCYRLVLLVRMSGTSGCGRAYPESIVKRAKAPGSSGSVVRKLIYSDMDQTRQCWRQAPSNLYRRRH
jgi:hypothetical protein